MTDQRLGSIADVIKRYDLRADKSRGQNFILDLSITARIAALADLKNATIIEVGAGPGGLTRSLLEAGAAQVIAIEPDTRFTPALQEIADIYPQLKIITDDALKLDFASLTDSPEQPYKIIANLPYNVATPLLMKWLDEGWRQDKWQPQWNELILMYQHEVAARICAAPDTQDYGRLSVWTQWHCQTHLAFDLPPQVFSPPPKVVSSVVQITPRPAPLYDVSRPALQRTLAAAFNQRRKMLRGSLKAIAGDKARLEAALSAANISGEMRPDVVTIEGFCKLAEAFDNKGE